MRHNLCLQSLSEKTLHQHANPDLIAYCPSMDLLALVTTDQQVLIYRLNGLRVYAAIQKTGNAKIDSIRWKPNGQLLAVAWSDGSIRLVGAESSKIVHQFSIGKQITGVTCIGWSSNLIGRTSSLFGGLKIPESLETLLFENGKLCEERFGLDLPRDLSLIDVESSLPRLSVLTSAGSEDIFSSRASLDALFHPFDPKDNNSVDVMIVGSKEGYIHVSIYDTFLIGAFSSPLVGVSDAQMVLHASHERLSTHVLLMKADNILYFVPMDLRFVSTSSRYLSLLASRSTALNNLLRYIHQVQILMIDEWNSTQDLPRRFLNSINETLSEDSSRDIVQALYHSVATGHTFPVVREWLVDELAERGHKRWNKAVVSGLENLKRLIHENMLPALERCSVILSRFSGIARFQDSNDTVSFTHQQIALISDTVICLHLVSSKILMQVVDELEHFNAFSSWLRYEIDRLASNASSNPSDDPGEKEAMVDHSKVLHYIQFIMTSSPLKVYFGESTSEDQENWNSSEKGLPMFDTLVKQLQKQEMGLPYTESLPRIDFLYKRLSSQAETIFDQIAKAEKRNVMFGQAHRLGKAETRGLMDMKLYATDDSTCEAYLAYVPHGHINRVHVTCFNMAVEKGISTTHDIASTYVQLGETKIRDIKFVDEKYLMLLLELSDKTALVALPYKEYHKAKSNDMSSTRAIQPTKPTIYTNDEVIEMFCQYEFDHNSTFVPTTLYVRQQNSTGKTPSKQKFVILGSDTIHYKILESVEADVSQSDEFDGDVSMS